MSKLKAQDVINRIHEAKGNIAAVARSLGVDRSTIYRYMQAHSTVQEALDEARQTMLDHAESVLYRKVLEGSTPELLFFLKTQGKGRGYVERQEHTGADGGAIKVKGYTVVTPDDWDDDDD